jgi:iron complex outermembrane receptor protein
MIFRTHRQDHRRTGRSARIAALSLLAVVGADGVLTVASAQTQTAPPATAASGGLEEITVTARRRTENLQEQPLSIQALTAPELEQMHVVQLTDVNNLANVNFTYQPGFMNTTVVAIRGIVEEDPVLTNDTPVALYVNGVLMARSIGLNFDLVEPQSVEVLRGPQGSLFGRNTTGGAVSIALRGPSDEFSVAGKAGYATNSEYVGRATLDTGLLGESGLKALFSVEYHNMDGYVRNALTSDASLWPGSDQTTSMYLDVHGQLGSVGNFDFRADYMHSLADLLSGQTTVVSPGAAEYFGASPAFGGAPYIYSPTRLGTIEVYKQGPRSWGKFGGTSLTLDFPINEALEIKSISAFRKFSTSTNPSTVGQGLLMGYVVNPTPFGAAPGVQRVSPYLLESGLLGREDADLSRQDQYSQEFQFSGNLGSYNKYVAGVFAFDEEVSESYLAYLTVVLPAPAGVPLPGLGFGSTGGLNYWGHSESAAVYVSDTFTPPILDSKLELSGGVRYTKDIKALDYLPFLPYLPNLPTANHEASFSDPSGDFTAKYRWTPDFMSYFRFANAYKSGGFSGRDAYNAPGYQPETANNWEIGIKSDWLDRRVRFNGDLFYTIYKNKQVTTYGAGLGSNGINESHVVNAGEAVYPGGEAQLTLALVDGWLVDINYGRTNPKYKEFYYQPVSNGPVLNIAGTAKFPYFSNNSYSIANTYTFPRTPIGILSARVEFDYKSGVYFHPSDQFNPLNEAIKAHSRNILNASIDLGQIPMGGRGELAFSLYGNNLLNRDYAVQGVDYEITPYDFFATQMFARPRVGGFQVTGKW